MSTKPPLSIQEWAEKARILPPPRLIITSKEKIDSFHKRLRPQIRRKRGA